MSENISPLENPLLKEDDYTGRMYHLSLPKTGELNCRWLKQELGGSSVDLNEDDLADRDDLHIPEVFQSGIDKEAQIASIKNVSEFHQEGLNGVMGYLVHNESDTVKYDNKEVLILDQQSTKFLIFEVAGQAFLLILASREIMARVYEILSNTLEELGFVVDEITIDHSEFEDIAESLVDTHLMTAVEDYEDSKIEKKHIMGHGFGESEEYKREKRQGAVHGQRFGTSQLDGSNKTIQISDDCLIRSYNNLTLSMYLSMIASHIVPSLSLTIQTSVSAYTSETPRVHTED
ncbi:hypothetical protein ACYJ1Y_17445 [Natrialbaceae archaeon A-gly3]